MRLERITLAAACLAASLLAAGALGAAEAPVGPAGASAPGAEEAPQPFTHLGYRLLGPAAGGRVSRVAGVPGDPRTYYAATAAGGVWRSVNGGLEWEPVFDDQPVSSIGSIAVAPSDPKVVYVGSGEANIRGNVAEGDGIYKSEDGGGSWRRVWRAEGQVGTVTVHPRDPDVAFAAVLGSPFGPSEERGVYRTTDGGATWRRVLFRDADTGASDVALDPANPRTVFAGLWQARRTPWSLTSGGPGSGLFVSRDGGETWKELRGEGLPGGVWGRVGVGVAPSDPRRVYALIEAEEGGLFRSEDGGATWERANGSRALRQRAWYYTTLTVDPADAETIWLPQVALYRTLDGGRTLANVEGGGWDYHDVWIDPGDPRRMIAASDAGVSLTWDGGATWTRPPLPISQFYRITTDGRTPYRVLGTIQDWGTLAGPSDSLRQGGVLLADWYPVGGGEAGWVAVHPEDPDTVWAGEYLGYVSRWDGRTGRVAHVGIYPDNGSGHPASDLRYRFQWTAPILASRHHPGTVYHAANVLFRSADGGQSWRQVSPDLTRDDPEKQGWSGGPVTGDITGVETYCTIFALAESPLDPAVLWAGTDDGRIHVTRDAGGTWTEVTPAGLPEWATVAHLEASRRGPGTAYAVADAHRLDDETPYLWQTADFGATWRPITAGLDPEVHLHVVREDPERPEVLYLGTQRGVRVSRDGGATWDSLQLDLPPVAVVDLAVAGGDLVVATRGRSLWVLDDLTAVREMSPAVAAWAAHLFTPRPAVAWVAAVDGAGSDVGAGANPPRGATFHYFLAGAPGEGEAVVVEVLDGEGRVIRELSSQPDPIPWGPEDPDWWPGDEPEAELPAKAGLNRAVWDLGWDGAGFVAGTKIDTGWPPAGPTAVPGRYTLRLRVGETVAQAPLEVRPDPRSRASQADLEAQLAWNLRVRDRMTGIAGTVGRIRDLADQLRTQAAAWEGLAVAAGEASAEPAGQAPPAADLAERARAILVRLDEIEGALHNPEAEVTYDILAGRSGGAKLYSRYAWLYGTSRDHAGPPTQGMTEVAAGLDAELAAQEEALDALVAGELARLLALAREAAVPHVVVPPV